jgi:hypothetical protein
MGGGHWVGHWAPSLLRCMGGQLDRQPAWAPSSRPVGLGGGEGGSFTPYQV